MSDESDDDWYKQLVKLHATEDDIASEFSRIIRYVLRSIVSNDYYRSNRYEASRSLKFMLDLIRECEKPIPLSNIVDKAIEELSPPESERGLGRLLIHVAKDGVKYLV
jgi:hypothetical protein